MSENQNQFENLEQAEDYLSDVIDHVRRDHTDFRGNRSAEQGAIAELASMEAGILVDGVMAGVLALNHSGLVELPDDYENNEMGEHTWAAFRGEFARALSAFGVATNRLNRDGYEVPSYIELSENDRLKTASALLSEFLKHNALRFGVDTAGVKSSKIERKHNDEGGIDTTITTFDKDKARNDREVELNMAKRGYASRNRKGEHDRAATHSSLKLSAEELKKIRKRYAEEDADKFFHDMSYLKDPRGAYPIDK